MKLKDNIFFEYLKRELNMNQTESNIINAAEQVAPNAPIIQAAEAAINTVEDPSVSNIITDIELLISLAKQVKTLAASHPTLLSIVKAIF